MGLFCLGVQRGSFGTLSPLKSLSHLDTAPHCPGINPRASSWFDIRTRLHGQPHTPPPVRQDRIREINAGERSKSRSSSNPADRRPLAFKTLSRPDPLGRRLRKTLKKTPRCRRPLGHRHAKSRDQCGSRFPRQHSRRPPLATQSGRHRPGFSQPSLHRRRRRNMPSPAAP